MKKLIALAGAAGLVLAALPALAQIQSPVSDWLRVYNPAGSIAYSVQATEADEVANPALYNYTINVPGLADPSWWDNKVIFVMENGTTVSDTLGVSHFPSVDPGYYLSFCSDSDPYPIPVSPVPGRDIVLQETGAPLDVTQLLAPDLRANGWTAQFWSDPSESSVPDGGATAGLLGMAVLALGWLRRPKE